MSKLLSPREYDIRSLAYYQAEGGVFNEIITILTKMRSEPKFRGLPSPTKSLNEACYLYDMKRKDLSIEEEKKYISEISNDLSKVLVALLATAWEDSGFCIARDINQIAGKSNPYLPNFDALLEKYMNKMNEVDEEYYAFIDEHRIFDLEEELKVKENMLATANAKIEELQNLVASLRVRNESKYDKALSRKGILEYVENQRIYSNVNQIFEMLMGPMSRVATDEEYKEINDLKQKMIDASMPINRNEIKNSNVFTGVISHPNFPIGGDPEEIFRKAVDLVLKMLNDGKE